jgi:hypothetical protein
MPKDGREIIEHIESRAVVWDCACGERHSFLEGWDNQITNDTTCTCGRVYSIRWVPERTVTLLPQKSKNPFEQKSHKINSWLRHHPDNQVTLRLCGLYGCVEAEVTRGANRLYSDSGDTLEKRLDAVIKYLERAGEKVG